MKQKDNHMGRGLLKNLIIAFLLVVCLCTLISVLTLKTGIRLEQLKLGSTAISGLHLSWREKLELRIDRIHIVPVEKSALTPGIPKQLYTTLEKVAMGMRLFSHLSVNAIVIDELDDTFTVTLDTEKQPWKLNVSSQYLMAYADIRSFQDGLLLDIKDLKSNRFETSGKGELFVDSTKETINGDLVLQLGQQIPVNLNITLDKDKISLQGSEAGKITAIDQFVDLFQLSPGIQRWITEYLHGSRYILKNFSATIPWSDPGHILNSLTAESRVENCSYTFAPGLEPIVSRHTDVRFANGVLTILPNKGTFYGQSTKNSWLDIDFTDPENIILTAHILTEARANEDIVNLLKYYNIRFPFLQIDGQTAVDLTLEINLNKNRVDLAGTFHIEDGSIQYLSRQFEITDTKIRLDREEVEIERLNAQLGDILDSTITGIFRLPEKEGELEVKVKRMLREVAGYNLSLLSLNRNEVEVAIDIGPENSSIIADRSTWLFGPVEFELGKVRATLDLSKQSLHLSPFELSSPYGFTSLVEGDISLSQQQASLQVTLSSFSTKTLKLSDPELLLKADVDRDLRVATNQESSWILNDTPTTFGNTQFGYKDGIASFAIDPVQYGTLVEGGISGSFHNQKQRGTLSLTDLSAMDIDLGNVEANLAVLKEKLAIEFMEIDANLTIGKDQSFAASFHNLASLGSRVKLLQDLGIEKGTLDITSPGTGAPINFNALLHSSLPILRTDNRPVDHYAINGGFTEGTLKAQLNKEVHIELGEQNHIFSDGVSYNLPELLSLRKKIAKTFPPDKSAGTSPHFTLEAVNSGILLRKDARVVADRISLDYSGTTKVKLEHDSGTVNIEIVDGEFLLEGKNLNNVFMSELFTEADYYQGNMGVVAKGSAEEFSALITINDVILEEFTTLNNILAFLNTIPALATFSLPGYDVEGLPITSIVAGLVVKGDVATIKSIDLKSPQFSMTGRGWINIRERTMDMDFNLITQAKKNIGKIPLLGYILVGEEKRPSVTIKVKGLVSDPKVSLTLFKEITTMPMSMLYRTLTLPYKMVESVLDSPN